MKTKNERIGATDKSCAETIRKLREQSRDFALSQVTNAELAVMNLVIAAEKFDRIMIDTLKGVQGGKVGVKVACDRFFEYFKMTKALHQAVLDVYTLRRMAERRD